MTSRGVDGVAGVYCRWERRRFEEAEFGRGEGGVLVHLGSEPPHSVNGRLVDQGTLETADAIEPPMDEAGPQ